MKINKYYAYSKTGKRHRDLLIENQDYFLHSETDKVEMIILADGVSSCSKSRKGAQIACETVEKILALNGTQLFELDKNIVANLILDNVLSAFKNEQIKDKCEITDYSSTLCFVCLDKAKDRVLSFSLGDSMIYKLSENGCVLLNQPDSFFGNKCCVTTTMGASEKVKIDMLNSEEINGMMICSDGAWSLFYNQNVFDEELWEHSKKQNYYEFKKYLDNCVNIDDSSFIIMAFLQNKLA